MRPRILNRAGQLPADGWYNIEANGEHINHRSRVIQVIDAKAITSIVNRFIKEAAGENFAGQRIDKDHLSASEDHETASLGWAMEVRNREGLLEAKIDWTSLGQPLIESQPGKPPVYKFFSTEYDLDECERIGTRRVRNKNYDVIRPLRLDGLSLTNDPNNKGQRPISNRNGDPAGADETKTTPNMKSVINLLGLADDASEASVTTALQKVLNRATTAEGQVTTLTTERDALLKDQVEADLEKYKPVIKNRDLIKKRLLANRADTIELLESMAEGNGGEGGDGGERKPITNRKGAQPPAGAGGGGGGGGDAAAEAEERRAAKIQNRARELRTADRTLNLNRSYELAEAEVAAGEAK